MIEKIIYDGQINATPKEIQELVDIYVFNNLDSAKGVFRIEQIDQKQVWVAYPPAVNAQPEERIIFGYVEIIMIHLFDQKPVSLRIVSCRDSFDLLFFQLSEQIRAKFIVGGYPPEVLTTPWRELIEQGLISPSSTTLEDVLLNKVTDPTGKVPRYGTDRDLTEEQVIDIVTGCRAAMDKKGTIEWFYNTLPPSTQAKFTLETLRDWVKSPKFKKNPRKLPR